jgi:uncharacterized iron-regulated membrane protein
MARSTNIRLRGLWFQVHKWIGLSLALLIIPIALSGAALVWHDALDEALNPGRYAVTGSEAALPPSAYAASARRALGPGEQLASLRYSEEGGPVVATATQARRAGAERGRPARTTLWLDPGTGRVLDRAPADAGLVRFMHQLHGSLAIPGMGRQIVGWVGIFMFCSCLTGIWLWWPVTGSVRRGFRWKRQNSTNANIHHLVGFWILLPLAMLSFTGFWISFPGVFSAFEASQPRAKGSEPDRARAQRARPLEQTAMSADAALAAARPHATGTLVAVTWPTDQSPHWKVAFARQSGPAEVEIADVSGEATPPRPPRPETRARQMRRLHDGDGMGPIWQAIVFLGGIIPAILAVTGIVMWLRSRGWRAKLAKRRKAGQLSPQPAE